MRCPQLKNVAPSGLCIGGSLDVRGLAPPATSCRRCAAEDRELSDCVDLLQRTTLLILWELILGELLRWHIGGLRITAQCLNVSKD